MLRQSACVPASLKTHLVSLIAKWRGGGKEQPTLLNTGHTEFMARVMGFNARLIKEQTHCIRTYFSPLKQTSAFADMVFGCIEGKISLHNLCNVFKSFRERKSD